MTENKHVTTEMVECVTCPECNFMFPVGTVDENGKIICLSCELRAMNHKRLVYMYVLWCLAANGGGTFFVNDHDEYTGENETINIERALDGSGATITAGKHVDAKERLLN